MERSEMKRICEAVLFAAGHAVTYERLSLLLEISERETKAFIAEYAHEYNSVPERGIQLVAYVDSCQLCTKEDYIDYIRAALGIRRGGNLSNSSLEVLSIIAYHQPVTRSFIEQVRGIDSSYAIGALVEKGLIECCGKLDAPGRPSLYATTDDFLRCFGLTSLEELPEAQAFASTGEAVLPSGEVVSLPDAGMLEEKSTGEPTDESVDEEENSDMIPLENGAGVAESGE
ncbi:MAG: SMC-Scp complex subunit ScpB [Clostridia bacterium]|nr:SMC-Scp complex subunit ScpB [Clostridia bacterium]